MTYQEKNRFSIIVKLMWVLGGIAIGFIICRIFMVTYKMPDNSMEPNVKQGDTLVVLRRATIRPGDIVLMESPAEPDRVLIKRIVSGEGDTIEVRNKVFYINNKKTNFTWRHVSEDKRIFPMHFTYRDNMPVIKLRRNEYFVLSDNLDRGYDSRNLGLVRRDAIIGRTIYKF